ncbi:putative nuclease HARBI1 [Sitophilus oryzae]|uniref:Putative nuclease HARBI1 n=1 Tax=Sitophilus oryzae TaxID=7048 RepID=A0A6J2XMH5_SITOR|nr:putative nuclease HARBI1 [Sitophilus oryzae]
MDPIFRYFVDEAEEEERQAQLRLQRIVLRDESNPFDMAETEFRKCFRLSRNLARQLIIDLTPHMAVGIRARKIPTEIRILGALRFFAQGSYQKTIGDDFSTCMAQPTFSRALSEVCSALEAIAPQWIKFPISEAEKQAKKEEFMAQFQFPGVIGCIDGTHVAIVSPKIDEHLYFNRKRYHSKNVQIICDANLIILNVKANYGGATHDSFIWRNSNVRTHMEQYYQRNHNGWLLGDSGYPQEPWLMTPIRDMPRESPEGRYTAALARTRNCVERCIGVLKNRFRCLLKARVLHYEPFKAGQIVNAVCVLHNMCIMANLDLEDEDAMAGEDVDDPVNEELFPRNIVAEGQQRRNHLIQMYFQNH